MLEKPSDGPVVSIKIQKLKKSNKIKKFRALETKKSEISPSF